MPNAVHFGHEQSSMLLLSLRLTWRQLYRQFGVDQAKASEVAQQAFRRDCLRELKKIKIAWPDLHYTTAKGALILSPSPLARALQARSGAVGPSGGSGV